MNDPAIIKDERTRTVENEGNRLGFNILLFGVLVDILLRSFLSPGNYWDLFALVIVSSWVSTIYQARHHILPPHFLRSMILLMIGTAVLSAVLALVIVKFRQSP
jgi:hypothetical protein